ncbi:MAG: hypothetical protein OJF52_003235 [Nitrospira sp.]|jgi:hypothetical protein|nr:hypothetical protein [Nitrospira sp.]WHZ16386.1 MAG: hypothetical protein OJF52_003235 [Nitrospira sp.]
MRRKQPRHPSVTSNFTEQCQITFRGGHLAERARKSASGSLIVLLLAERAPSEGKKGATGQSFLLAEPPR